MKAVSTMTTNVAKCIDDDNGGNINYKSKYVRKCVDTFITLSCLASAMPYVKVTAENSRPNCDLVTRKVTSD